VAKLGIVYQMLSDFLWSLGVHAQRLLRNFLPLKFFTKKN